MVRLHAVAYTLLQNIYEDKNQSTDFPSELKSLLKNVLFTLRNKCKQKTKEYALQFVSIFIQP